MGMFDFLKKPKEDDVTAEIRELQKCRVEAPVTVESIRDEIMSKTAVPCMRITLTDEKPSLFDSKAGGIGYVPRSAEIPADSKGNPLQLLAQIDCSQVTIPDFPHEGLLQFWILNDDLHVMNFDAPTKQDTFRVIYHPEIDRTVTEAEVQTKIRSTLPEDECYFPVTGCWKIKFEEQQDLLSASYCSFETRIKELVQKYYPEQAADLLHDPYDLIDEEADNGFGHKMGGYPGFTQYDPRDEADPHDVLLFQLDSDYDGSCEKVMWGDSGIGNFFINREKLRRCDFSDVLYNWDCC